MTVSLILSFFKLNEMAKMQNVDFRNVEEFLEYLTDDERKIVECLRAIIIDCIPECKEKLSYNVPYFSKHSRICFIPIM